MKPRKYPFSMFLMDMVFFLIRRWQFVVGIILLFVVRIFIPQIPVALPLLLLVALLFVTVVEALRHKKALLEMNPNEETSELLDKMFADNNLGYKNITHAIDEIIEKHDNKPDA